MLRGGGDRVGQPLCVVLPSVLGLSQLKGKGWSKGVTCDMFQSFRKEKEGLECLPSPLPLKEDFSRNMKALLCLRQVGLPVVVGLESNMRVQTLILLMTLTGQVPSPWASAS